MKINAGLAGLLTAAPSLVLVLLGVLLNRPGLLFAWAVYVIVVLALMAVPLCSDRAMRAIARYLK